MRIVDPYALNWNPNRLRPAFWYETTLASSFTFSGSNITGWINIAAGAASTTLTAINRTGGTVTVNSREMLNFNGSNQLFLHADNSVHKFGSADFSLWTVWRCDDVNRGYVVSKHAGTVTYLMRVNEIAGNDGNLVCFIRDAESDSGLVSVSDINYNDDAVRVVGMQRDGSALRSYRGSTEVGTAATLTNVGTLDNTAAFNIGAVSGASPSGTGAADFYAGEIGEVIGIKRALDAAERVKLAAWLAAKWGL